MPVAVEARGLSKTYIRRGGTTEALTSVDLTIPSGRIYGMIGRNGAGKTTFVRISATQLTPTSGTVSVLGHDVLRETSKVRAQIAAVPQESRPLYFLNVDELIYLYLNIRGLDSRESRRRTNAVLDELGLASVRKRLVSELSGGMRRRAMVAMVLASDADVLFLDEPTTGLDPIARREVWGAVRRAARDGRTVLLTTHYLDEAEALSSRIALLEGGRVRLEGTPSEIRDRVRQPYRIVVSGVLGRSELESFGTVSPVEGGFLIFAKEAPARELALLALSKGAKVSMGPVTLEDVFLQVVGKSIDSEDVESGAEAAG
ncbi:MAG TPA: ABC transporter ATP-binding protein [Thermoplasmata archaeon]|nr:ABC transporter ATP-binding protein [Thermoplasmata archaeon]